MSTGMLSASSRSRRSRWRRPVKTGRDCLGREQRDAGPDHWCDREWALNMEGIEQEQFLQVVWPEFQQALRLFVGPCPMPPRILVLSALTDGNVEPSREV